MWLTSRLMPDFKTVADFRRDNGPAIRAACAQFVVLCRQPNLFTRAVGALDGSKFKAAHNCDTNFTTTKWRSALSRWRPASPATWLLWIGPNMPRLVFVFMTLRIERAAEARRYANGGKLRRSPLQVPIALATNLKCSTTPI